MYYVCCFLLGYWLYDWLHKRKEKQSVKKLEPGKENE